MPPGVPEPTSSALACAAGPCPPAHGDRLYTVSTWKTDHAVRPSSASASTVAQTSVLPRIGMNCSFLFFPQHVVPTSLMPFVLHNSWFCLLSHHSPFLFPPIYVCVYTHIFMYLRLYTHSFMCIYFEQRFIECTMPGYSVNQMHLMPPPWS